MSILDEILPHWYDEPIRLGLQRRGGDVVAIYDIVIRNVSGGQISVVNPSSTLTQEEKAMVVAMYQRDLAQFEAATGLELWIEPEG